MNVKELLVELSYLTEEQKELEIVEMKSQIQNAETEKKLALKEAVQEIEKEREQLKNDLKTKELEKQNIENSLKQQYANELQNKDAIIKYKDDEIARQEYLDILQTMGAEDPRTAKYRKQLTARLF
mgnify:CR=1 FL=1